MMEYVKCAQNRYYEILFCANEASSDRGLDVFFSFVLNFLNFREVCQEYFES